MAAIERKKLDSCNKRISALLKSKGIETKLCTPKIPDRKKVLSPTGISDHLIPDLKRLIDVYSAPDEFDLYEMNLKGPISPIEALKIAAKAGRLDVFKRFLGESKSIEQKDKHELLLLAAGHGHVNVLEELRTNWKLTRDDARTNNNATLITAVENGHVNVLEELRTNWRLTRDDARTNNNQALRLAVANQHIPVLVELRTNWKLTQEDVRADNNFALRLAKDYENAALLKELQNWK